MKQIDLDEERRALRRRLSHEANASDRPHVADRDLLAIAGPDAGVKALRAQVRLWHSKHELSRERLVKLWLLYEDAQREIRGLRAQLARLEAEEEHARAIIRAAMDHDDAVPAAGEGVAEQFRRWDEPAVLEEGRETSNGNGAYHYGPYTLYELPVGSGRTGGTFYFFSRNEPRRGTPARLPDGYQVELNPVNGLPYVRKALDA